MTNFISELKLNLFSLYFGLTTSKYFSIYSYFGSKDGNKLPADFYGFNFFKRVVCIKGVCRDGKNNIDFFVYSIFT